MTVRQTDDLFWREPLAHPLSLLARRPLLPHYPFRNERPRPPALTSPHGTGLAERDPAQLSGTAVAEHAGPCTVRLDAMRDPGRGGETVVRKLDRYAGILLYEDSPAHAGMDPRDPIHACTAPRAVRRPPDPGGLAQARSSRWSNRSAPAPSPTKSRPSRATAETAHAEYGPTATPPSSRRSTASSPMQ